MNLPLRLKIIEHYNTHWKFAQAVDVSESFVSKVLRGSRPIDADTKKKWAAALKCKPGDIFKS